LNRADSKPIVERDRYANPLREKMFRSITEVLPAPADDDDEYEKGADKSLAL
jgi:hypothetical protein